MENNSTGISVERLVSPTNSSLDHLTKCNICFNILVNPQDCDKCGNTFCFDCINTLFQNNKPCPFNCENYSIKPSSLVITTFLANLKFYCLNKEQGCDKQLDYLQVLSHDKECSYSNASCPNVKCKKSVKRQLLEYHIRKECEFSLFKCENCEMKLTRSNYIEHVKNCKVISDMFDLKNPIIDSSTSLDDFENIKESSMSSFFKILLFQMAKSNSETNKKIDFLCEEISILKEDAYKNNTNSNILIENITNEIETLNEKMSNVEIGLSSTENMRKIVENNLKETVFIKENISPKEISTTNSNPNTSKPPSTSTSVVINPIPQSNLKTSLLPKGNTTDTNVKKINLRSTYKGDPRSPQNRSPVNQQRSPNSKNFQTNFNSETESFVNKTNNITFLKTMLKNQDTVLEKLTKIVSKLDVLDFHLTSECKKTDESLKVFLKDEVLDELKALVLETSLDSSNVILKKLDEVIK